MTDADTADVQLITNGEVHQLPVVRATEGGDGIVVSSLLRDTGLVTVDPGFMNTASCESQITYIDGDAGILRYRGYPIEQLAEHSSFLEVAYLLIHGELPSAVELDGFVERVNRHTLVHEDFRTFMGTFPRNGHPMAVMSSAINALSAFYPESLDPFDPETVELATVLILAKTRTVTSYLHRTTRGEPLLYPDYSRGYVDDFLRMTFAVPYSQYEADPVIVKALDKLLILHADHEQNCSTSTVRIVGSSHANLYASVAAGVNALSGPLHGGANEAVLKMLTEIQANGGDATDFMTRVKNKEAGVRLMGFGHRVYKNYDPRAAIVKQSADAVLSALGKNDELLEIAMGLEEIALSDDYFI
ncbi:MAG TPA: citrate synthase, partial [Cellulomonas sp.]